MQRSTSPRTGISRSARTAPRALAATILVLASGARADSLFGLPGGPAGGRGDAGPAQALPSLEARVAATLRAQGPARGADRHALRARLTPPRPTPGVRTLVIAFEGTGAFEPRLTPACMEVLRASGGQVEDGDELVSAVLEGIARIEGRSTKWSALNHGIFPAVLEDPTLLPGGFDWAAFPSEEAEVLAGMDALTPSNIRGLLADIERSVDARPRATVAAGGFLARYLRRWPAEVPRPRLVVASHSSGGRSAVKFLEYVKPLGVTADLVFTIDPVREAHEALGELAPQMLGQGTNYNLRKVGLLDGALDLIGVEQPVLPRVWSRPQPESLYKTTNARRWVSLFQRQDTRGMKIDPHHGIQGSPIANADHQEEIRSLGEDGHGAIGYHERTLELWRAELRALHRP